MNQKDLKVEKTARYFTIGNENANEIWVVLHGYGQLANYFLKRFESIASDSRLVVAPEGLHRFYWNGFSGRIVASWMTKEDRLHDIDDYVSFLDQVALEVNPAGDKTIHVIGFSQGAATAARWALLGNTKIETLSIWAGAFPSDIDYFANAEEINGLHLKVLVGDEDEFINEEGLQKQVSLLQSKGIEFDLMRFKGGHNIYEEPLQRLISDRS